jgi:hypothetical protein
VAALPNTELRIIRMGDARGDEGTLLMTALAEALAEENRARVAGAILITDGQVHDLPATPACPRPVHVLLTGRETDWDRRLIVRNAPAFAILGEDVTLTLRIEDQGAVPAGWGLWPNCPSRSMAKTRRPSTFPWARIWNCPCACRMAG